MMLSAKEVNTLKVMIEDGAGESLYNRLKWDESKRVRLSQYEKDVIAWNLYEKEKGFLCEDQKTLCKKLLRLSN